jgi:hypothetical protein
VLPNQTYYFKVGQGKWGGRFSFRITDRDAYHHASVGLINRLLILALRCVIGIAGPAVIASTISIDERQGPAGTGWNTYKLTKWGITLCVFNDIYQLDPGGERVAVTTDLRYGPVPGILTGHVEYSASIFDGGFRSRYDGLRLLGAEWVATYHVAPDTHQVEGVLTCAWAEAREQMFRRSSETS